MKRRLHIYDPRERQLVRLADAVFDSIGLLSGAVRAPRSRRPHRILLLRLERIGDLLMTADALALVRVAAPEATIHLAVGSWNVPIARMLGGFDRMESLDLPWLTRERSEVTPLDLLRRTIVWRRRRYDLVINFEGDVRTNLLASLTAAPRRVGFGMAGGGGLLTDEVPFDPSTHTSENALRLVRHAFDLAPEVAVALQPTVRLAVPDAAVARVRRRLAAGGLARCALLVGIHASGGRAIKQWPPERFGEVAARLARVLPVGIVLTGTEDDRPLVDAVRRSLPSSAPVTEFVGADLAELAAALGRLDLFITGDTGPMHLAAALDTPVVAVFGPSDPVRYAPRASPTRIVRVDLPCSPCNRIRLPPARCTGHTPDCLAGVGADAVLDAAIALLQERAMRRAAAPLEAGGRSDLGRS